MYLLDTNIWLERLLDQERGKEVAIFLNRVPSNLIHITDFSFHSICISLLRLDSANTILQFVKDVFIDNEVSLLHLSPQDTSHLISAVQQFHLDFDDAYQYVAAETYDLIIVSFDSDFDRTDRGRQTPAEVLAKLA